MAPQHSPGPAIKTLRDTVGSVLSRHYGRPRRITGLRRRRSAYASSCPIDNLRLTLDHGQELELVFKDLSPAAELPTASEIRPHFLFDPRREIAVYRELLQPQRSGTAVCYGSMEEPALDRFWLFLERVRGSILWQSGRLEAWADAARWLARFHGENAPLAAKTNQAAIPHLLKYDRHFFERWLSRAEEAVRRSRAVARSQRLHFRRLVDRYDRAIARLIGLPATVIHGEFFPSNIVIRRDGRTNRVCPVDWELCGTGPGVMDLAALIAGDWAEAERQRMIDAYRESLGGVPGGRPSDLELTEAVKLGRLQLALQMLGWAADWTPPAEHSHDWLAGALRLARELGV